MPWNWQVQGASHQEHFHDALAGTHHVDGIGRFVGGNAKVLAGADFFAWQHGFDRIQDIHFDHSHQREGVFLASNVFQGRQVQHIIVSRAGAP